MTTMKGRLMSIRRIVGVALCGAVLSALAGTAPASAEEPWWNLNFVSTPAHLPPNGKGEIKVEVSNLGDLALAGSRVPVTITDKLPEGMTAIGGVARAQAGNILKREEIKCAPLPARSVTCTWDGPEPLAPYETIVVPIEVEVGSAKSGEQNEVTVTGGEGSRCKEVASGTGRFINNFCQKKIWNGPPGEGKGNFEQEFTGYAIPARSYKRPVIVDGGTTPFGVEDYEMVPENEGGSVDTQAGSHPFQLTTTLALNESAEGPLNPPAPPKDLHFNLPPGLVGNPTPLPQCSAADFATVVGSTNRCPLDTAVGAVDVKGSFGSFVSPVYNLTPEVGEPARFGFQAVVVPVFLDTSVKTGGTYGVTVSVNNIPDAELFTASRLTFWGVPGDPRHDQSRGWACSESGLHEHEAITEPSPCVHLEDQAPQPFLSLPTSCEGPFRTTVEADSWTEPDNRLPGEYTLRESFGPSLGMDGCNRLPFAPSIKVTPDGQAGSTPTGLTVDEHISQSSTLAPEGLAESDVKGLTVTLPEGVVLNPSGADGLQACSMEQVGLEDGEATSCPEASKVATAVIRTPLLPNPLEGAAYLATQNANPFGSLVALYVFAEDATAGIRAKATGEVLENPVTGQLTAHFEQDPVFEHDPRFAGEPAAQSLPEVPFEDVELHFFGGDRAPLGTPARCGSYETVGTFSPWSGDAPVESSSEFQVTSGPSGTPCPSSVLPFAPTLTAGTTSIQAAGFTPFAMTMSREDGEQDLQAVQLHMPAGLSGILSGVKLCGEEQANAGTCGPESLIGETVVSVGLGGDPYTVTGGKVYITGPYRGAPFGLSIVNPAKAGPFNLGFVVVRAKIEVNEETAALTVTTDTEGPYKIPTIIDGIPLQIKHVNVSIDRPGFIFNPTNCSPSAITGTLFSSEATNSTLSIPFQVTNCAVLAFKPQLSASTSGKASKANGTSLSVKLGYPAGPYDANIARVKVELPKGLPSRLTTLRKACLASTFESNPAACPPASIIGHATATTPELPVPLSGPAYFVSHGGEAFPSLIIVLQGYGVTVHLVGTTFISKAGITSSTFKTVPDAPVGGFELTLPNGPYSALTTDGNLCKQKLQMPTEFVGQNGAVLKTSTKIAVTGCPKAKQAKHKKKAHRKAKAKSKGKRG